MKKMTHFLVVLILAAGAGTVNAVPINVNGLEWLQPVDFVNLSWNDISPVCDPTSGACTGLLNGVDVTGYTWADVDDMNGLFNHYLGAEDTMGPGPDRFRTFDIIAADTFFADGWEHQNLDTFFKDLFGWTRSSFDSALCTGLCGGLAGLQNVVFDPPGFRNPDLIFTDASRLKNRPQSNIGAWLYRDEPEQPPQIPIPATLPLLGLGLAALGYNRRKHKLPN